MIVLWHTAQIGDNFTASAQATILYNEFENFILKLLTYIYLSGVNELMATALPKHAHAHVLNQM